MIDTIKFWCDGDSLELESLGRCRLAKTETPEKYEQGYKLAKRTAEHLASPGTEVNMRVVGKDTYGRKLVVLQTSGRSINSRMIDRFAVFNR